MERRRFAEQVRYLHWRGKSIRSIAAELGVNRGRVDRALKLLASQGEETLRAPAVSTKQPDSAFGVAFVGRQKEIGDLLAALQDAVSGHGRVVTLVGEPGIGKTRTAQEFGTYATTRGAEVLWGRCYEDRGAPPYWPWSQAIGGYVNEQEPDRLRCEMGSGAGAIAEILPAVRERLGDVPSPPPADREEARFRLFESVAGLFKAASQSRPIVLMLDDLHAADAASLQMLSFLGREIDRCRLLVVAAYRDAELALGHPLAETLAELTREQVIQRVPFKGFDHTEVSNFIEVAAGVKPTETLARAVYDQTGGNPLFVTEVVRLLEQEGGFSTEAATSGSMTIRAPEGVRDVVGRRLSRLSEHCIRMLTTASAIGREFELRQLSAVLGDISEDKLLETIDEALGAKIIEEPRHGGRYEFTHGLIQDTISQRLSAARRPHLHARIAQALEGLYGPKVEVHADRLAHHFGEAEAVLGPDKMIEYSLIAGEQALAAYAFADAVGVFQRALDAKDGLRMDGQIAALLSGLGRAQGGLFQWSEGLVNLTLAFNYFVENRDLDKALMIPEYFQWADLYSGLTHVPEIFSNALAAVPADSHQAARLLPVFGYFLGAGGGDYRGATAAFDQAVEIAHREEDKRLEMRTLCNSALVNLYHLRFDRALSEARSCLELARQLDDPAIKVFANYTASSAACNLGDLDRAKRFAEAASAAALGVRDPSKAAFATAANALVALAKGDWETVRAGSDATGPGGLVTEAVVEAQVGDFETAGDRLELLLDADAFVRSLAGPSHIALAVSSMAAAMDVTDWLHAAEKLARSTLSSQAAPFLASMAHKSLGLIALRRGDVEEARAQYAALKSMRPTERLLTHTGGDTVLGLLAQGVGNLDLAESHFESELAVCLEAGVRPDYAWACHDLAGVLVERAATVRTESSLDRERAVALLDEALRVATDLGMKPLGELVSGLRQKALALPPGGPTYPAGLTQREVQVLHLIAAGKTNREIADELVVSVRTVGHHVRSILDKTGSSNRTEAAMFASRQGLL